MTPSLQRFNSALNLRGQNVLGQAVQMHGAQTVEDALAWHDEHAALRKSLVRALVRASGFDVVVHKLGASTIEVLRELSIATEESS